MFLLDGRIDLCEMDLTVCKQSRHFSLYLYTVGQYKRVKGQAYTFVIPKEWVADTAVELAKVQRRAGSLDYRMGQGRGGVLPDAGE